MYGGGHKTTPFYVQFLLEQFKTALIGAHRNRSSILCNDKLRMPVFLQCSQNGHELFRYGDLTDRVTYFWGFGKTHVISVLIMSVVTRFGYSNGDRAGTFPVVVAICFPTKPGAKPNPYIRRKQSAIYQRGAR